MTSEAVLAEAVVEAAFEDFEPFFVNVNIEEFPLIIRRNHWSISPWQ
jgi:hypothetical protein